MDPTTLAAGAVGALVPYLAEAGKAVAKKVGEAGFAQCGNLWNLIRSRLTGTTAQAALEDLHREPADSDVQGQARLQLRKALEADPAFARDLAALLPAAQSEVRQVMQVTGDNNTVVLAAGSTVTITGKS